MGDVVEKVGRAPTRGAIKAVYEHLMGAFEKQDRHNTGYATSVDIVAELRRGTQEDGIHPHVAGEVVPHLFATWGCHFALCISRTIVVASTHPIQRES